MPWLGIFLFGTLLLVPGFPEALKVVYNESYAPFSATTPNGVVGIEVDLVNEMALRMNLAVTHEGLPWERAQLQVKNGTSDAFVTVSTPLRLEYVVMSSEPLFSVNLVAATSKNNPRLGELQKLTSLEQTYAFPQVNYLGAGWAKNYLKKAQVYYLTSTDQIFNFLLANRADLYIESDVNLYHNSGLLGIRSKIQILPLVLDTVPLRLGVSKASPFAARMPEFNRVISEMRQDGTVDRIMAQYGHFSLR